MRVTTANGKLWITVNSLAKLEAARYKTLVPLKRNPILLELNPANTRPRWQGFFMSFIFFLHPLTLYVLYK
jgi:hypothetical protein